MLLPCAGILVSKVDPVPALTELRANQETEILGKQYNAGDMTKPSSKSSFWKKYTTISQ